MPRLDMARGEAPANDRKYTPWKAWKRCQMTGTMNHAKLNQGKGLGAKREFW